MHNTFTAALIAFGCGELAAQTPTVRPGGLPTTPARPTVPAPAPPVRTSPPVPSIQPTVSGFRQPTTPAPQPQPFTMAMPFTRTTPIFSGLPPYAVFNPGQQGPVFNNPRNEDAAVPKANNGWQMAIVPPNWNPGLPAEWKPDFPPAAIPNAAPGWIAQLDATVAPNTWAPTVMPTQPMTAGLKPNGAFGVNPLPVLFFP